MIKIILNGGAKKAHMLVLLVALLIGAGQPFASALEPPLSEQELRDSSLVGDNCPSSEKPLFRAIRDNYFPPGRIIANMLGDETAEHVSWAVTRIIRERNWNPSDLSLDQIRLAKRTALDALRAAKKTVDRPCSIASIASLQTSGGGTFEKSAEALGILSGDTIYEAEGYAIWDQGAKRSTIVEIHESDIKRAGYSGIGSIGLEWAFPVFIPHYEITAAWSHDYYFRKVTEADGSPVRVEIRKRLKPGFIAFDSLAIAEIDAAREGRPLGKLLYVARTCRKPCNSSESAKSEFLRFIGDNFLPPKLGDEMDFQVIKAQ